MDFNDIGPLQLLVVGFGPDAEFEGLVLDELERLTARGLIRVIDLRFVTKDDDGELLAIELSGIDADEAAEFGAVIDRLIGIAEGSGDETAGLERRCRSLVRHRARAARLNSPATSSRGTRWQCSSSSTPGPRN